MLIIQMECSSTHMTYANMMDSCKLAHLYTSNSFQKRTTEVLSKNGVLKNFTKFKVKQMCGSLFFDETAGFRPETLLKKRLRPPTQLFSCKFFKYFRSTFFYYLNRFENSNGSFMCITIKSAFNSFQSFINMCRAFAI